VLLAYFFDMIPEKLGKLYSKLFDWHPEGKRVFLRVTEGEADFYGTTVSGTIIHTEDPKKETMVLDTTRPSAIIQLDSPWQYKNRTSLKTKFVAVVPRFFWHGVYRLLITSAEVHVFPVDGPEWPHALLWKDMIAICSMKLIRSVAICKGALRSK